MPRRRPCLQANQFMKGFQRSAASGLFGGVLGALIGATAFSAVDFLIPETASAQVYGANIVGYSFEADLDIHLVDYSFEADKDVYVAGKCRGQGNTDIHLVDYSFEADEDWHIVDYSFEADMDICLSGDLDEWFEHAN